MSNVEVIFLQILNVETLGRFADPVHRVHSHVPALVEEGA